MPINECENCGAAIDVDSDFCPQCGMLFAENQYSCTNHPLEIATGACVLCHQVFCDECLTEKKHRLYCAEHKGIESSEGWSVIFTSSDFYEAQIVRGKLESAGIATNSRNTTNIGVLADGFMDNALGRTVFKYPIKIFIPADQFLEAQQILNEKFSSDDESEQH